MGILHFVQIIKAFEPVSIVFYMRILYHLMKLLFLPFFTNLSISLFVQKLVSPITILDKLLLFKIPETYDRTL